MAGNLSPNLGRIIDFIDVKSARKRSELLPDGVIDGNAELFRKPGVGVLENVHVGSGGTVDEPGDSFKTNTDIDDLDGQFFTGTIVESLELHEDHVTDFETTNEIFHGGTAVTTASPDVFDVGDLIGVNAQFFSQPSVVEFNAFFLEEDVVIGVVEHLDTEHNETRVMSTSETDVIQIIESHAELRADKGICGGIEFTSNAIRLEAVDTGSDVVDIVSPTSNDGVSVDGLAGNSSRGQTLLETLPGFSIGDVSTFTADTSTFADEFVRADALGVTASISFFTMSPVVGTTLALSTGVADFFKDLGGIEFVGVGSEFGLIFGLDFFGSHGSDGLGFFELVIKLSRGVFSFH